LKGISCTTVFFNWFGFITIPLLSFISFSFILILLFLCRRSFLLEK
jgi:disulfide bond formation protein DsbB